MLDRPKSVFNLVITDVNNILIQIAPHADFIKSLQAIDKVKIGIVGDAFPVKFKIGGVFGLINDFAQKQINQHIKGIFTAWYIVLA